MGLSSSLNLHNFGTLEDYMLVSIQNFLPFEFVGYFLMIMFRFLFWVEISQIIYLSIYLSIYHLGASLAAQMIKNLPAMWKTQVQSLGQKDLRRAGNGNPLQYSYLGNIRGAWRATAMG